MLALAIAMGIGRFAFTPMLPLMIRAGSVDVAAGGWLAAANYAGYLLGALTTARVPLTPQRIGLLSLAVIVLSTAAMGWTDSVAIWLLLRFVAGVASAWALVSTSVWCLGWLARLDRPAGAGVLYAGVGVGIALAGLYCWRAGVAGVVPEGLWMQLGALALVGLVVVAMLMPREAAGHGAAASPSSAAPTSSPGAIPWGLVLSYGVLGFGYILPATFLPVLARAVVDDPSVFGAAWPVFGTAAALSTVFAGAALVRVPRRHVLAGSHVLMALGCLLPVLHLSAVTVLLAALLVGGTFMVATMAGMQEAKASSAGDPTRMLGRMTAAFAIGQMAGPVLSSALSGKAEGFGGLFIALAVGAAALLVSAAWLARKPSRIV
jgi:predicted MFS family arabinose efflux permease